MKLVRFESGQQARYGVWEDNVVKEVTGSIYGNFRIGSKTYLMSDIRLLAPVEPTKILCVGLNFRDHIEEIGFPFPTLPAHFLKPLTTLIGPDDPIVIPRVAKQVDYEGELAAVIKRQIKDVSIEEAAQAILG